MCGPKLCFMSNPTENCRKISLHTMRFGKLYFYIHLNWHRLRRAQTSETTSGLCQKIKVLQSSRRKLCSPNHLGDPPKKWGSWESNLEVTVT